MSADESRARVENGETALLEQIERPEAGLDPLDRRRDVDPPEGDIARPEPGDRR